MILQQAMGSILMIHLVFESLLQSIKERKKNDSKHSRFSVANDRQLSIYFSLNQFKFSLKP